MMPSGSLIGVCGPVGAGKSTLVRALAAKLGFAARGERVSANPFFERYAQDRARWAFWSQLAFISGAVNEMSLARESGDTVLERPPEEMFGVFVRELGRIDLLTAEQLRILEQVTSLGVAVADPPDLLIVLRGDPQKLLARLQGRGDPGDDSYDLDEMKRLSLTYDRWQATLDPERVIERDVHRDDLRSTGEVARLAAEVTARLNAHARH